MALAHPGRLPQIGGEGRVAPLLDILLQPLPKRSAEGREVGGDIALAGGVERVTQKVLGGQDRQFAARRRDLGACRSGAG